MLNAAGAGIVSVLRERARTKERARRPLPFLEIDEIRCITATDGPMRGIVEGSAGQPPDKPAMTAPMSNEPMQLDPFDASNFIESGAGDSEASESELSLSGDVDIGEWTVPSEPEPTLSVEERFGRSVLRLRLYRGWSQRDLQRTCGVHQSQISRLESGRQRGMSIRRLFAILRALHVDEIALLPETPASPPTALELMLWGDPWERAGRAADRRSVNRRRSA